MIPTPTASLPGGQTPPILKEEVKAFIIARLQRGDPISRITALVEANFQIAIDRNQMLACWLARNAPPTQTGPRQEKASMQIPPEEARDVTAQRMTRTAPIESIGESAPVHPQDATTRLPAITGDGDQAVPATQAGPEPEQESAEVLTREVREFIIARMARRTPPWLIAEEVERDFEVVIDREAVIACWRDRDSLLTQTGPRQEKESMPILNDEIKEFIVKSIACYETPSRIAAAVRINFGIEIDRRQVFEYNPAGSRPPAQRWIDLHAATRARFVREIAEIGIAQKAIRLRMLERFAEMAEESNHHDRAAKFLEQAARECGGFYEKQRAAAPASPRASTGSESTS